MSRIKEILIWSSIVACFVWTAWRFYEQERNKEKVMQNYDFAIGKIISYRSVGTMNSKHLTYNFYVNGVSYSTKSSVPNQLFPKCEYYFSLCSSKRFWVAYQKDDPSNSLINLYIEIQGIEDPKPPQTWDGFR